MNTARPMAMDRRARLAPWRTKSGAVSTHDDVRASTRTNELSVAIVSGIPAIVAAPPVVLISGITAVITSTGPGNGRDEVEHLRGEIDQRVQHPVAAQQQHGAAGREPGNHRERLILNGEHRLEKAHDDAHDQ